MKRCLLLCLLLVCLCNNIWASNQYSIYNVTGHVEINNGGWHKAERHEIVNLLTEFKIFEGGEVAIADSDNGLIIKYDEPTSEQVLLRDIIRKVESQRSSLLFALIKELFTGQDQQTLGFRTIGGVSLSSGDRINKDLSDMIFCYAFEDNTDESKFFNDSLVLSEIKLDDDYFCFKITNLSDESLFANIVAYDENERSFSLPLDVLRSNNSKALEGLYVRVPAHSEVLLDQFVFVKCENIKYRVFGSTEYFENHTVAKILSNMDYGKETESPHDIFIGVNE